MRERPADRPALAKSFPSQLTVCSTKASACWSARFFIACEAWLKLQFYFSLLFIFIYLPTYLTFIYWTLLLKRIFKRSNYVYFRSLVCVHDFQWPAVQPVHPVHRWSSGRPLPLPIKQAGPTAHNHPYQQYSTPVALSCQCALRDSLNYLELFHLFLAINIFFTVRFFQADTIVWI